MNRASLFLLFVLINSASLFAQSIGEQARSILQAKCHECHGIGNDAGLDVLDPKTLFAERGGKQRPFISKSNLEQSEVWRQIEAGLMPPEYSDHTLTSDEKAIVRSWIESGADFPEGNKVFDRPFATRLDILNIIENDLRTLRGGVEAKTTRYFTIANLHNNGVVSDEILQYARAGLSKGINCLSLTSNIVVPRIVDVGGSQIVMAIDLRDYGWTIAKWNMLLEEYPYSLVPETPEEFEHYEAISKYWDGIEQDPCLRVDWFLAHALRAPMYEKLLDLPDNLDDLAMQHGVDMHADFQTQNLIRGGVFASGVSTQNRLMDRHESRNGCFWISYDFGPGMAKGNISVFPLGPNYVGHPFPDSAFEEAGSELVFSMPNGLHAYLIVDDQGKRIERAPVSIVSDSKVSVDGVPEVVNGLSCIGCHDTGIRDFENKLRNSYFAENARERSHLQRLFGEDEDLHRTMSQDREVYLRAVVKCLDPFFPDQNLDVQSVTDLKEPCTKIARLYFKDVDVITAASELGLENPEDLKRMGVRSLIKKGLAPFTNDGIIKRQSWHGRLRSFSVFQETAKELLLGQPVIR